MTGFESAHEAVRLHWRGAGSEKTLTEAVERAYERLCAEGAASTRGQSFAVEEPDHERQTEDEA